MTGKDLQDRNIILFDGICNLCNASVRFIIEHERKPEFLFASIQSDAGKQLLERHDLPPDDLQSVILIENGNIWFESIAVLKIGQTLRFPWSFLCHASFIVPKFFRDWVYKLIARNRYHWFGKRDICILPNENLQARFL
jgi:predicted DCC family thiol-disulfide oxidoreductase YuxK